MKDGEFDRVRIPLGNGTGGGRRSTTPTRTSAAEAEFEQRLRVAATPAQLAAGSAILAGLVLVGLAALRRRRSPER